MVYCAWRNLSVPVCRATERTGRANVLKLLVLDGNSIVNRAFYGIKVLTTKDGRYTNALVGFMNILLKLENDVQPDEVAIAFDLKAPTFRHKMYDGYKAQRKGMPQELADQMPVLKQLLADLGYRMVTCEGYERTIFWARFRRRAKRAVTTASSPPGTATACSWWGRTPQCCWPAPRWAKASP